MAPSFLPRLTLSRSPPLRTKPSEYDLSDLSPRSEYALRPSQARYRDDGNGDYNDDDDDDDDGGQSNLDAVPPGIMASPPPATPPKSRNRVLFAGPPPPIASSMLLSRDLEDGGPSLNVQSGKGKGRQSSLLAATATIGSVLFGQGASPAARDRSGARYEQMSVWQSLQRREKSVQNDIQRLLDFQSAGLSAGLDQPPSTAASPSRGSLASESAGSLLSGAANDRESIASGSLRHASRSRTSLDPPARATAEGELIPVRQPKDKPMGLRASRAGLARSMAVLAALKAEEDASLAEALSARKIALARLLKMSARRDDLAEELRSYESDDQEPLTRELRDLGEERLEISTQIAVLEERLAALRNRKRRVEGRMETVKNKREAGLSGYRGALREVEAQIAAVLRRPPVAPLDSVFMAGEAEKAPMTGVAQSPGGSEFLRMRPERRTAQMAKEWWEIEVEMLERRKQTVDKDRAALEEGSRVWTGAVQLVSDFEADMLRKMKAERGDSNGPESVEGSSASQPQALEEAARLYLADMQVVIDGLEEYVQTAQRHGWTLLVCAVGAELAAFKEADLRHREYMRRSGINIGEAKPRTAHSSTDAKPAGKQHQEPDVDEEGIPFGFPNDKAAESDNEVPADLLVSHTDEIAAQDDKLEREAQLRKEREAHEGLDRDDSENEIPPEFLQEHRTDDES